MFGWINRLGCLRRIIVSMDCCGWNVDQAVEKAIFRSINEQGYLFCYHPELISDTERYKLRSDAEIAFHQHKLFVPEWQPVQEKDLPAAKKAYKIGGKMGELLRG